MIYTFYLRMMRNLEINIEYFANIRNYCYQKYIEKLHCTSVVNRISWHRIRSNPRRKNYHINKAL